MTQFDSDSHYTRWAPAIPGPPRQTDATRPMQKLEHVDGQRSAPRTGVKGVTENMEHFEINQVYLMEHGWNMRFKASILVIYT